MMTHSRPKDKIAPTGTPAIPRATQKASFWHQAFEIITFFDILVFNYFMLLGYVPLPASIGLWSVGLGCLLAQGVLHRIITYSANILQVALFGFAAVSGVAAVSALATGHWLGWIVPALLSAWSVRFVFQHQRRIIFISANLKVVAIALKSVPSTIGTIKWKSSYHALFAMMFAISASASIASLHTVTAPDGKVFSAFQCETQSYRDGQVGCVCGSRGWASPCVFEHRQGSFVLGCFWLAKLIWITAVMKRKISVAISTSITSWWISAEGEKNLKSLELRSVTNKPLRFMYMPAAVATVVRLPIMVMRRLSKFCRPGFSPVVRLRNTVDYALTYAAFFVGTDDLDFAEAGRRVEELFKRRGATALANDTVVDVGVSCLALGATALYMVTVCLLVTALIDEDIFEYFELSTLFGSTIGIASQSFIVAIVLATMFEVFRSGSKAVFFCFVQNPEALAANHGREIYDDLSKAWRMMQADFPELDMGDHPRTGQATSPSTAAPSRVLDPIRHE